MVSALGYRALLMTTAYSATWRYRTKCLYAAKWFNCATLYTSRRPKTFIRYDLPPTSRTKLRLVKSVKLEQDGHEEEQIYRRTDHWLSQTGRGWYASQGTVPQWRVQ